MLDQSIFSRVVGNDRQPSVRLECVPKSRQRLRQTFQLVIYRNANRLK
jgi:hypothetical protein